MEIKHSFPHKHELRWHTDDQPQVLYDILVDIFSVPVKKNTPTTRSFLVCREVEANRPHLVAYIFCYMSQSTLRTRFKAKTNAFGNADYKISDIRKDSSALSYSIKEGDYIFDPTFETLVTPISEIEPWIDITIDQTFDDQVKELDDRYLDSDMDDNSYLENLLAIYANSKKKSLFLHHIKSHWLALFNRRNRQGVQKRYTDPEDLSRGYIAQSYNPRQVLVDSIKKFIID